MILLATLEKLCYVLIVSISIDQHMNAIYDWFSPLSRDIAMKQYETFNIPAKQDGLGDQILKTAEYQEWLLGSGKPLWCIGSRKCCLSSCVSVYYLNSGSRSLLRMAVMSKELVGQFQSDVHETGDTECPVIVIFHS